MKWAGETHMQRKNRLIWNFLLAYLTVLIPMLLVSFLVSGQTIRRMEENSYHAIQDRVNRASKDFVTLLNRYEGSSAALSREEALIGEFWTQNIKRYDAIHTLKSVANFDTNVTALFLTSPNNDVFSSMGYSRMDTFTGRFLQLKEESVVRLTETVHSSSRLAVALTRRDDTEHFLLLHYPATVMYKTKGTVNYLFGQNFVARQLRSLSPEAPAYIQLLFSDGSSLCFYEQDEKTNFLDALPSEETLQGYTAINCQVPYLDMTLSVYYSSDGMYEPIREGLTVNTVALCTGMLLSLMISLLLSARRLRGIHRLEEIASGKQVTFRYSDEFSLIGNLLSHSALEIDRLSSHIQTANDRLRQQTVQMVLSGAAWDREMANRLLAPYDLALNEEFYFVGVLRPTQPCGEEALTEQLRGEMAYWAELPNGRALVFMGELPNPDEDGAQRKIIARHFRQLLQGGVTIGLSQAYQELSAVDLAVREALEMSEQETENGEETIVRCFEEWMGKEAPVLQLDQGRLQAFKKALREQDTNRALRLFDEMNGEILSAHSSAANQAYLRYCILQSAVNVMEEDAGEGLLHTSLQINVLDNAEYTQGVHQLLRSQETLLKQEKSVDFSGILDYIQAHYADPNLSAMDVAEYAHTSKAHLGRLFKLNTGKTYIEYVSELRLQKACEMLTKTQFPVTEITTRVGYTDHSSFRRKFKAQYGISVTDYRKQYGKEG